MLFLLLLACDEGRRFISEQHTPSYSPAKAHAAEQTQRKLRKVASGAKQPTEIHFPSAHPNTMLVLEKTGSLLRYVEKPNGGTYQKKNVIASLSVRSNSELGLLGIALHPDYARNRMVYLHSNPKEGALRSQISEWKIEDFGSWKLRRVRTVLEVEQPYANHNGGQIHFGPDGYLYVAFGDGGWRDDPHGHGQNTQTLLGSIIRIQPTPDKESPYVVPKDNPFVQDPKIDDRIFIYGVRNPWKFSFAKDGQLIIADVGQNKYEEVSVAQAGENLGWKAVEGKHCFETSAPCSPERYRAPIWEYEHDQGTSITGGYILNDGGTYNGSYIVGDFTSGRVWSLGLNGEPIALGKYAVLISTFGRDTKGRVYLADFSKGEIHHLSE